jgi:hypothetical protein
LPTPLSEEGALIKQHIEDYIKKIPQYTDFTTRDLAPEGVPLSKVNLHLYTYCRKGWITRVGREAEHTVGRPRNVYRRIAREL